MRFGSSCSPGAESIRRAHNLAAAGPRLDPLRGLPPEVEVLTYEINPEIYPALFELPAETTAAAGEG